MLTTVDALKAELGITGTAEDAYLTSVIRRASSAAEAYCNRAFGRRTVTDTLRLDTPRCRLILTATPVVSIASVAENGEALTATDYELDASAGLLDRLRGDAASRWARGKTVVTYEAGYVLPGAVGADLPADVEQAVLMLCVGAYTSKGRDPALRSEKILDVIEQSFSAPSVAALALPGPVAALLAPHRRVTLA